MTEKYIESPKIAVCAQCGASNSMYIHRPTGKFYCKECFDHNFSCNSCHRVAINGISAEKLWWCWDCYLKDFYSIVRRKPKTDKDFKLIQELSKPIWQKK